MAARKRRVEVCVYCPAPATEKDHVFPRSWYPTTTPKGTRYVKVPSCRSCNAKWQQAEDEFSEWAMLVANTSAPELAGVWERLTRSWRDPSLSAPDAKHRIGKLFKIQRTMIWAEPRPNAPQVVVRTPAGLFVRASPARKLKAETRQRVTEKFIRGFHFVETGIRIGEISVKAILKTDTALAAEESLTTLISAAEKHTELAPGLIYARLHTTDTSFWAFRLWGQFNLIGMVRPALPLPAGDSPTPVKIVLDG